MEILLSSIELMSISELTSITCFLISLFSLIFLIR